MEVKSEIKVIQGTSSVYRLMIETSEPVFHPGGEVCSNKQEECSQEHFQSASYDSIYLPYIIYKQQTLKSLLNNKISLDKKRSKK